MPRIAAAIGVFATIAICILINVKRYPAVWDMVGSSSWFTQATNAASEDPVPQPAEIAENEAPKKTLPAPQSEPQTHVYKPLPSLRPQMGSSTNPATDAALDSSADKTEFGSQMEQTPVYQNMKPEPIKVSDPVGESWPAEMSPRMKYAAKPPLLESYQQWNPERPVVPVVRPKKEEKKDNGIPPENQKPAPRDSSRIEPAKQTDTFAAEDKDEVVKHLPPVDSDPQPIRMSIQGAYPEEAIPVYPSTGR